MKKCMLFFFPAFLFFENANSQNVGIGIVAPESKLHIKGSADTTQFIIDANSTQSNSRPLIKFRNSAGADLMWIHSDDQSNTFLGYGAGKVNDPASIGLYNTFLGSKSGMANSAGRGNTAAGYLSLSNNTIGSGNAAFGISSLYLNTIGNNNTAMGSSSLQGNTMGDDNTAVGMNALALNTTAGQNIAVGSGALGNDGFSNGGVAWQSGNISIGVYSLFNLHATSTTNAVRNTVVGNFALYNSSQATENTAIGYNAMLNNTTGNFNSCLGKSALTSLTTGYNNVAIGVNALNNLVGGSNNIAIGAGSGTDPSSPNVTNTISIGNIGFLNAASNQVFIGNFSTLYNGGNKTWSVFSDARIKRNITEDVKGLDFILRLRPVTYYRSIKDAMAVTGSKATADYPGKYDIEKVKETGFLAQEVEKAAKDAGYDFSGVYIPSKANQLYTLSYEQFVVPLVKAIQEQQQMIKDQQKEIDLLKIQNANLAAMQSDIDALKKRCNKIL